MASAGAWSSASSDWVDEVEASDEDEERSESTMSNQRDLASAGVCVNTAHSATMGGGATMVFQH